MACCVVWIGIFCEIVFLALFEQVRIMMTEQRRDAGGDIAHSRRMMKFWEWVGLLFRFGDGAVLKDKNSCCGEKNIFVC